jgi:uncharacterized protein (TIGR03084 family)
MAMTAKAEAHFALIADLQAEYESLDATLAALDDSQWRELTPFRDWSVFDTVAHLCISERIGLSALMEPEAFVRRVATQMQAQRHAEEPPADWRETEVPGLGVNDGEALRALWRRDTESVAAMLSQLAPDARVPWYGPSMSVMSFATARLMETWAHGETIHDALNQRRHATQRLRHICDLGWRTRGFALMIHGLPRDETPIYLALQAPSGGTWSWGDPQAANRINGKARDFARVVCQCRSVSDTYLVVEGAAAAQWMSVAQCFAGGPVSPPLPGARKRPTDAEEGA